MNSVSSSEVALPYSWVEVEIGDVAQVKGGKRLPKGKSLLDTPTAYPYIRVTDFDAGTVNFSNLKYLDENTQKEIKNYTISKDDLYISIAGTIGLIGEIPEQLDGANLTENAAKLCDLNGVLKSYLRHVLSSHTSHEQFQENTTSSGQPKLALFRIKSCCFPLPPLAEQKVIADKLDTLLAQVETTKARLERIPEILKSFRQSVLSAAVSGKLTEEWRGTYESVSVIEYLKEIELERIKLINGKKLKKSVLPRTSIEQIESDLPNSWAIVHFEHIAAYDSNALKAGPFGSALKKSDCTSSGFRVYGQEQVIAGDERLVTYYINESKFNELSSCAVESGDILVSLVGTIGKVLILSDNAEKGIINPRLVKLSLQPEINRSYIQFYLQSIVALDFFKGFSHGGTMDILNLGILKDLPINLPPLKEQTEIVHRVEELFAFADRIEQAAQAAQSRVNNLTQSILAKAFRGELTADWRAANPKLISGDNSAAALLEKIKAERALLNKKKRG